MNKDEATSILRQELSRYRERRFSELLSLIDQCETLERLSPSGTTYQIEVRAFWDDESERTLRVMGAVDDGGWRSLKPLCDDFIMRPDGSFVGE